MTDEAQTATETRSARDEPLYNIGVVERMTGVPAATLRVWERRYGFPNAARTPGGHRIYSDGDVERLRWVKARTDEGMQAGKAVHALEVVEADGRFPEPAGLGSAPTPPQSSGKALAAVESRLLEALLDHDADRADQILGESLAVHPLEALIVDVIRPVMVTIGHEWSEGRVSVATEHYASHFVRQRLISWMPTGPVPRHVRPVVLACAPDEWHDTSLLMMGVLLRRRRWPVAYLGQAVPLPDLARFVESARPPAVVVVAMRPESAATLVDWPMHLPDAARSGRPVITFGGAAFIVDATWRERVPGTYLGDTIEGGLDTLDLLLRDVTGVP